MKAARNIALAAVLAAPVLGSVACPDFYLDLREDEAQAVLSGLVEMANEAKRGTHTYACPFGGEATNTVTVTSEELGDSGLYRYGTWDLSLSGCRLAVGYPDRAIDGFMSFASRTLVFDSGRQSFKVWVGVEPFGCSSDGLSKTFWKEAGDDGPFTESLVVYFCGAYVEIPLSSFPSAE